MSKISLKKIVFFILFLLFIFIAIAPISYAEEELINIDSPSALLINQNSGKIIYEKNIYEKKYPASLTKIMTAIIVLENCQLDEPVLISKNAIASVPFGYVVANLKEGEQFTVEQLLNLLLVGSANDAALVLAEHVSGSIEDFSNLMNSKAQEIGCKNTNFVNPNGEHNENHYTTAYDLSLITRYAMKNDIFRTIVSKTFYSLPVTDKYLRDDRFFTTTNSLLLKNSENYYKYAIGIKTGYTSAARNCLISAANKNNLEFITIILDAPYSSTRYLDSINLFEYGFNNYELKHVAEVDKIVHTINVKGATRKTKKLALTISNDIFVLINKQNSENTILPEIKLNENLKAPIKKGEIVGTITYLSEGISYTENLIATADVQKSYSLIYLIGVSVLLVLLILCIKRKNN